MEHFYYSFVLTLLHSLWQAALLLCMYFLSTRFLFRMTALQKRNAAYLLLSTQTLISLGCFLVIYHQVSIGILLESLPKKLFSSTTPQITADLIEISFFAYLVFFFSKLIRLGFSFTDIWNLSKKDKVKAHPDLRIFATQKAYQIGIKKPVSVWYSAQIKSAITFGIFKPIILLPVSILNKMSMEDAESIILHELHHIKQYDFALNVGLQFAEILFCFNPFILKLIAELKLEREKSCDMAVLQFNYPMLNYAEALLKSARETENDNRFLMNIVFGKKQLFKRIQYFSAEKNRDIPPNKIAPFFLILLSILMTLFSLQVNFSEKDSAVIPGTEGKISDLFPITQSYASFELERNTETVKVEAPETKTPKKKIAATYPSKNHKRPVRLLPGKNEAKEERETVLQFQAIPVSYVVAVDSIQSTEVTIQEENSSGEIYTSIYRITRINDTVHIEPIIMLRETPEKAAALKTKSMVDSVTFIRKDSIGL